MRHPARLRGAGGIKRPRVAPRELVVPGVALAVLDPPVGALAQDLPVGPGAESERGLERVEPVAGEQAARDGPRAEWAVPRGDGAWRGRAGTALGHVVGAVAVPVPAPLGRRGLQLQRVAGRRVLGGGAVRGRGVEGRRGPGGGARRRGRDGRARVGVGVALTPGATARAVEVAHLARPEVDNVEEVEVVFLGDPGRLEGGNLVGRQRGRQHRADASCGQEGRGPGVWWQDRRRRREPRGWL